MAIRAALVLAGLAMGSPGVEGTTLLDTPTAEIRAEMSRTEGCTVGLDEELCLARLESNGTLSPGDDELTVDKSVESVAMTVRPPLSTVETSVIAEPSRLQVEHPVLNAVNRTWVRLNDTLPDDVRQHVTLDSRAHKREPYPWGLFVTTHLPEPAGPIVGAFEIGVCWDGCPIAIYNNSLYSNEEKRMRLFPHNVWLQSWATDDFVASTSETATECWSFQPGPTCAPMRDANVMMRPGLAVYDLVTPNLALELRFNRTVLSVRPPGQENPPSGEAPPGVSPAPMEPDGGFTLRIADREAEAVHGPARAAGAADLPDRASVGVIATRARDAQVAAPAALGHAIIVAVVGTLLALAIWLLYYRTTRHQVLDQTSRRRVYEAIGRSPGVRVGTLAKELSLSYAAVLHHVRTLERFGFVQSVGDGQKRHFLNNGAYGVEARTILLCSSSASARRILRVLGDCGATDISSLAVLADANRSTTSKTLLRLEAAGLVTKRRSGRRSVVALVNPAANDGPTTAPPIA